MKIGRPKSVTRNKWSIHEFNKFNEIASGLMNQPSEFMSQLVQFINQLARFITGLEYINYQASGGWRQRVA